MDIVTLIPLAVSALTAGVVAYEAIARRRETARSLTVEENKVGIEADTFAVSTYRNMVNDLLGHVKAQETIHQEELQQALDLKSHQIEQLRRELAEMRRQHVSDQEEIRQLRGRVAVLEAERANLLRRLETVTR